LDDPTCSNSSGLNHGFTNQEMLDDECMVNLNARVYDPTIARFLSADPTIEQITNLQDLNRYSYVGNNPLSFTDPSGLCFLGCFWNNSIFRSIAALVVAVTAQEWALPELEGLQSGAAISTGTATLNAGISGGLSGFVATGRLNGALYGALEGVAFAGVHVAKADMGIADGSIGSGLMHGAVGGLFSMAGGQGFKSGFLAAGFSDIAGDGGQGNPSDITSNAILGGIGSVLGGGKFMNGAITGAFGVLYNDCLHFGPCRPTPDDQAYVRTEASNCPAYYDSTCTDAVKRDGINSGLDPNIDKQLGIFAGGTIGLGALGAGCALACPAAGDLAADAFGPGGSIFGRARMGGSSLLNINANDLLRIGWGWKGSATAGEDVFRLSGDWVESWGVKSGHIDVWSAKSGWFPK
jgi:RHS repeat-associated protein